MGKALRLSEKWFQRGLWLVAFVFAGFLIGLGGSVVGDLPQVEKTLNLEDFIDQPAAADVRSTLKIGRKTEEDTTAALEQAELKQQVARSDAATAADTFANWLATRGATNSARARQFPGNTASSALCRHLSPRCCVSF